MRRDTLAPYLAAGATGLAALALVPVVTAHSWPWYALLMVAVVTASGMVLRSVTRPPSVVVLGQLVVGIIVLTMAFARDNAVLGIFPGPDALHDLFQLGTDGMDATRQFSTPAPDLPGLTYLVTIGVFGVALAVDALAVTGGTAVGAGLPLLVLYCVPAAVLPGGASAWSFAAVSAGWLVLLAHDGRLRIDGWGRILRTGPESRGRRFGDDLEVLGTGARRLGIITIAVAIAVPLLLPSLPNGLIGQSGEGDGTGTGGGGRGASAVDPILTLRQNLTARSAAPVLTYTTDQANPPLLRLVADDRFDGETWRSSRPSLNNLAGVTLPTPPGLAPTITTTAHTMRVKVGSLAQGYLPVPYPVRSVKIAGTWVYAADSLDIISRGRSTKGLDYTVNYLEVQPTSAQLQTAPQAAASFVQQYTQLPNVLSPEVARLARQLTATAPTDFDKAVALQKYFRDTGGFIYDTNVDTSQNADAVSTFLASKRGYCVQFASAMAVMARTLGIPARVGVGFLPGTRLSNGRQGVSLNDAHAWPELYFEGVGWVRFEPTPAVRTGAPPSYSVPGTSSIPTDVATRPQTATPRVTGTRDLPEPAAGAPTGLSAGTGSGDGFRVPGKVLVLLALLVLGLAATPVAALLARWRRRRRARDIATRVEATWTELIERADDLGIELPIGSTPRRIQAELMSRAMLRREPADSLARLVFAVERVRYAPPTAAGAPRGLAPDLLSTIGPDLDQVVKAIRTSRDRSTRLRARVLPRSGTDQLVVLSARAGERIAGVDRRIARTGRSVTRGPGDRGDRGHSPRRRRMFGGRAH
ncbi:MAG: transglutaminaseTgpA domain-containing protein [Actinomycetales bacterium]